MARGKIVFLAGAQPLFLDLQALSWDRRKLDETGERVEDPGCPNHKPDALLYAWRKCFHYAARDAAPQLDSRQRMEAEVQKHIDQINKGQFQRVNRRSGGVWDGRDVAFMERDDG
jgi:hypothetical protein